MYMAMFLEEMFFNRDKIKKVTDKSTGERGCCKTNIYRGFLLRFRDTISEPARKLKQ